MSKKEKFMDKQTYVHWLFDVFPDDSIRGATMMNALINMKKYVLDEELFKTIFDLCYKQHSKKLQENISANVCDSIEIYNRINAENFQLIKKIRDRFIKENTHRWDPASYSHKYSSYNLSGEIFDELLFKIDDYGVFMKDGKYRDFFLWPQGVQVFNNEQQPAGGHAIGTFYKKVKEGPITNSDDDNDYVFYIVNAGAGSDYQNNLDTQVENYGIVGIKTSLNKLKMIYTLLISTSHSAEIDENNDAEINEFIRGQLSLDEFYYFLYKILLSDHTNLNDILNEKLPTTFIGNSPKLFEYTIIPLQLIGNCTFNSIFYTFDLVFKYMTGSCEHQLSRESAEFYNSGKVALFELFANEILEETNFKNKTALVIKMNETYQLLKRDGAYDLNDFTRQKKVEHYELSQEINTKLINYAEVANEIKALKPIESKGYIDEAKEFCVNSNFSFNLKEPNNNTLAVLNNLIEKLEETLTFLKTETFKIEKLVIYLHHLYNCVAYISMIRNRFEDFILPRYYQTETMKLFKKFINLVENDNGYISANKAYFITYENRICMLLKKISAGLCSLNNDFQSNNYNIGSQSIIEKYFTIYELSISELVVLTGLILEKIHKVRLPKYKYPEKLVDEVLQKTMLISFSDIDYLCYMKELLIQYSRFLLFAGSTFSINPSIPSETYNINSPGTGISSALYGQYMIKGSTFEHKICIPSLDIYVREKVKPKQGEKEEKSYCDNQKGNLSIQNFYELLKNDFKNIKSLTHFHTNYIFHLRSNKFKWTLLKLNLMYNEVILSPSIKTNDEPFCGDLYMCLNLMYSTVKYKSVKLNNINNIIIAKQRSLFKEESIQNLTTMINEFTPVSLNLNYLFYDIGYDSEKVVKEVYTYLKDNFNLNKTIINKELIIQILEKIKSLLVNNLLSYKIYNRYTSIIVQLIYISKQLNLDADRPFYERFIDLVKDVNEFFENTFLDYTVNSFLNEADINFDEIFSYFDNNIKKFKSGAIGVVVTEEEEISPAPGFGGLTATPSGPSLRTPSIAPPAPMLRRTDSYATPGPGLGLPMPLAPPRKRTKEEIEDGKYLGEEFCLILVPHLFKYINEYKRYINNTSNVFTFFSTDFGGYDSYVYRIFKKSKYIFGISNGKLRFMIPSEKVLDFEYSIFKMDFTWDVLPESFKPDEKEIDDTKLYKKESFTDLSLITAQLDELMEGASALPPGAGGLATPSPGALGPGGSYPDASIGQGKKFPGVKMADLPLYNPEADIRIITLGNLKFTFSRINNKFKYFVYYNLVNVEMGEFTLIKKVKESFDYKYSFVQYLFDTDYDLFNLSNLSAEENSCEYKGKKLQVILDDNSYSLTVDSKPVIKLIDLLTHENDKLKDIYCKIFNFFHSNIDEKCASSKCFLNGSGGVVGDFYNDIIPYLETADIIKFWCPNLNATFSYNLATNQLYFGDSLVVTEKVDYLFNKYVYDTNLILVKNENYEIIGLGREPDNPNDSKIYNFTIPINGIFAEDKYEILFLIKQNLNAGKYYDVDNLLCNIEVFSSKFINSEKSIVLTDIHRNIYYKYFCSVLFDFLGDDTEIYLYDTKQMNPKKKIIKLDPDDVIPPVSIVKHYEFFKMMFMEHFSGKRQNKNLNTSFPVEFKEFKKELKENMKRQSKIPRKYPLTLENKLFFRRLCGGDYENTSGRHSSIYDYYNLEDIWWVLYENANCEYDLTKPIIYTYKSKIHNNKEIKYDTSIFDELDAYLLNDLNLRSKDNTLNDKEELTIEDSKIINDYKAFLEANKSIIIISKEKLEELNARVTEKIDLLTSDINEILKSETSKKYMNYSSINDNLYDDYGNDNGNNIMKIIYIQKLLNVRLMINNELSHSRTEYNFTSIKKVIEQKPFYKDYPKNDSNVTIMEYIIKFLIRDSQEKFSNKLVDELVFKENCGVHQLLMGEGKSTVIAPLLTIKLQKENKKEGINRNIIHGVPKSLVKQSTLIFKNIFIYLDKIFFYENVGIKSDEDLKEGKLRSLLEPPEYDMQEDYFIYDEIDELADPLKSNLNIIHSKEKRLENDKIIFIFIFEFIYKLYFDPANDFLRERLHSIHSFSLKPHLNYSGVFSPGIESLIKEEYFKVIGNFNPLYPKILEQILTKTEIDESELSQINMGILSSMYNFYILVPTLLKNLDRRHFGLKFTELTPSIVNDIIKGTELEDIPHYYGAPQTNKRKVQLSFKKHKKYFIAVPFIATEKPSDGSEFSDQLFTIAATIICYLNHDNFKNIRIKDIEVSLYLHKVIKEYKEYIDEPPEDNAGIQKYNKLVEGIKKKVVISSKLKISAFGKNDIKQMKKNLIKYLIKDYMIEILFDSLIRIYPTFDNISFLDLIVKDNAIRRIGFTGTPNMLIPYDYTDPLRDVNNICRDIDKQPLGDGAIVASILGLTDDKKAENKIITSSTDIYSLLVSGKYHSLIDVGSLFLGTDQSIVSQTILEHFLASAGNYIQVVIFIDKSDNKMGVSKVDDKFVVKPFAEINNPLFNRFFYFDQGHITGIDFKIYPDAKGLITLSGNSRFRDVAQGIYRLRNINKGQSIDFCFTSVTENIIDRRKIVNFLFDKENNYRKGQEREFYKQNIKALFRNYVRKHFRETNEFLLDEDICDTYASHLWEGLNKQLNLIPQPESTKEITYDFFDYFMLETLELLKLGKIKNPHLQSLTLELVKKIKNAVKSDVEIEVAQDRDEERDQELELALEIDQDIDQDLEMDIQKMIPESKNLPYYIDFKRIENFPFENYFDIDKFVGDDIHLISHDDKFMRRDDLRLELCKFKELFSDYTPYIYEIKKETIDWQGRTQVTIEKWVNVLSKLLFIHLQDNIYIDAFCFRVNSVSAIQGYSLGYGVSVSSFSIYYDCYFEVYDSNNNLQYYILTQLEQAIKIAYESKINGDKYNYRLMTFPDVEQYSATDYPKNSPADKNTKDILLKILLNSGNLTNVEILSVFDMINPNMYQYRLVHSDQNYLINLAGYLKLEDLMNSMKIFKFLKDFGNILGDAYYETEIDARVHIRKAIENLRECTAINPVKKQKYIDLFTDEAFLGPNIPKSINIFKKLFGKQYIINLLKRYAVPFIRNFWYCYNKYKSLTPPFEPEIIHNKNLVECDVVRLPAVLLEPHKPIQVKAGRVHNPLGGIVEEFDEGEEEEVRDYGPGGEATPLPAGGTLPVPLPVRRY